MRFSSLLTRIGAVQDGSPRDLAGDPEITGAEALDRAGPGQLAFLEPGNALAAALSASGAAALLLPLDAEIQQLASERGLAWVALANPRLGFAEALAALHPPTPKPPGIHPSAVIDPSAAVAADVHVGAHGGDRRRQRRGRRLRAPSRRRSV